MAPNEIRVRLSPAAHSLRYIARFGQAAYDVMLGDCRWHVHRMEGKLAGRIDVLRRPGGG